MSMFCAESLCSCPYNLTDIDKILDLAAQQTFAFYHKPFCIDHAELFMIFPNQTNGPLELGGRCARNLACPLSAHLGAS